MNYTNEELIEAYKALLHEMAEKKTRHMIDANGTVWTFNKWYGSERPWFITGLGHWSERGLREHEYHLPWKAYVVDRAPDESDKKWLEFYTQKIGDDENG